MHVPGHEASPANAPAGGSGATSEAIRGSGRSVPRAGGTGALSLVVLLTILGAILRVVLGHQPLFADELSTWWIVSDHGLRGVLSTVRSDAEITPPLYFAASWLTTQLGHAPELVRAPSLIAGTALIPLVYAIGVRTVGRGAALVASALTAIGPFALFYSADARGYAVMMAAVGLSTLAMLLAVDTGGRRWWVVYAVSAAAAVYSHYTSMPVLAAQAVWVLWAHPEARRPGAVATAGAVVLFLPWTAGLLADLNSPTTKILAALSPFDWAAVRFSLTHWVIGYPAAIALPLDDVPGRAALVLLVLAIALPAAAVAVRAARGGPRGGRTGVDRRIVLVLVLALTSLVADAGLNVVGTHLFSVRNLAASWPYLVLSVSGLLVAAGPRLRVVAVVMALAAFGLGAVKLLQPRWQNPDVRSAATLVDRQAGPGDVVIDGTGVLSPGPPTPLDVALGRPHRLLRAAAPEERDHPFTLLDPVVTTQDAIHRAIAEAAGNRIFLVTTQLPKVAIEAQTVRQRALLDTHFPATYRLVDKRYYHGVLGTRVLVYARR